MLYTQFTIFIYIYMGKERKPQYCLLYINRSIFLKVKGKGKRNHRIVKF